MGSAGAAGAGGGGTGGSSNGGAAGASGGEIEPLFDVGFRAVGTPCDTDADCPVGPNGEAPMVCIPATSTTEFGGGPQGGYCSVVCRDETDNDDCLAVDGLSACGLIDPATQTGYCIGLCQPGTADGAVKCGADRAQACFQFPQQPEIGACFPTCQSDAACGEGQFCDFGGATGLGLCSPTLPPGGDVGAPCTPVEPPALQTDCKSGVCLTLTDPGGSGADVGSFCSANCTFGLLEGCGFARTEAAGARDAVCLIPQADGGGPGDLGFCFELCNVDADCAQADQGWICVQDLSDAAQDAFGRLGECLPPEFALSDGGIAVDAGN